MEFKNVSGLTREIPALGLSVPAGGVFEAQGDEARSLLAQGDVFERVDKPEKKEK